MSYQYPTQQGQQPQTFAVSPAPGQQRLQQTPLTYATSQQQQQSQQTGGGQSSMGGQSAGGGPQKFMIHPQLGQVKGPQEDEDDRREEVPYPVYIRPYDDELPQVTWRKNPAEPFGTLTILKGEDKMIVKVPMKNDRVLPRTNYPVEALTIIVFLIMAAIIWRVL